MSFPYVLRYLALLLIPAAMTATPATPLPHAWLAEYDVHQTLKDSTTCGIPLIARGVAAHVWVENGDILIRVGDPRNNVARENNPCIIRLRLNSKQPVTYAKQSLGLRWWPQILIEGTIDGDRPVTLVLSGSTNQPLIQAIITSPRTEVEIMVEYETWRQGEFTPFEGGFSWIHPAPMQGKDMNKGTYTTHVPAPFIHGGCVRAMTLPKSHPAYDRVKDRIPELIPLGVSDGEFKGVKTQKFTAKTKTKTSHLELAFTFREFSNQSRVDAASALIADAARNADMFGFNQATVASETGWTAHWASRHIHLHRNPKLAVEQDEAWQLGRAYQLTRNQEAMAGSNSRADSAPANAVKINSTIEAVDLMRQSLVQACRKPFPSFDEAAQAQPPTRTLEAMLLQTRGDRLLLGSAWPAEWACDFKLNAPDKTTVEGRVQNGVLLIDRVTPESRRKDIEVLTLVKLEKD